MSSHLMSAVPGFQPRRSSPSSVTPPGSPAPAGCCTPEWSDPPSSVCLPPPGHRGRSSGDFDLCSAMSGLWIRTPAEPVELEVFEFFSLQILQLSEQNLFHCVHLCCLSTPHISTQSHVLDRNSVLLLYCSVSITCTFILQLHSASLTYFTTFTTS